MSSSLLTRHNHHQAPIMPVKRMVTVEKVPLRQIPQPSSASITTLTPPGAHVFQLSLDDSDEGSDSEESPGGHFRRSLPSNTTASSYFSHGGLEPIAEQSDIPPSPHPSDDEGDDNSSNRPNTPNTLNEQQDRFQAIIERLLEDQFGPAPDSITPTPLKAIKTNTPQDSTAHDDALLNLNSKPSPAEIFEPSTSQKPSSPETSQEHSKDWRISKTHHGTTLTDKQATLAAALNIKTHPHSLLKVDSSPSPTASVATQGSISSLNKAPYLAPHYDNGSIRSTSSINSPITINNSHHSWSSQYRPMQPFHSLRRRSSKEEMGMSDTMSEVTSSVGSNNGPYLQRQQSRSRGGPTFTSYKSCNDLFVVRHALENNHNPTTNNTGEKQGQLRPSASYTTLATQSIHSSMFQEPYQARRLSDQLDIHNRACPCPRQDIHELGCRLAPRPLDPRHSTLSFNPTISSGSSIHDASLLINKRPISMPNASQISLPHHPLPPPNFMTTTSSSKLSIASFSLTHDKDAIKTYRRMANKTNNKQVQMTYCKYLLQVAELYKTDRSSSTADTTRRRIQEEAEYWIEKLAANGSPEALYIKGMWHATNDPRCVGTIYKGIQHEKAFKCLRAAAKAGWIDASYQVARYWKDRGDYKKTLVHYKAAAHQGHVLANYKMAKILLRGQLGQKVNIKQGLEYLKSAADATTDDSAAAAFDLSCIYSDDIEALGMERDCLASRKNVTMAMHYLVKAQHSGHLAAHYQLGKVYESGLLDQQEDWTRAFDYYSKAAEQGHELAMLALARFYLKAPHPDLAFKWCQRAAMNGLAEAEFTLGTYYESGIGVEADYPRALEYFGKSASKGFAPAAERLNLPTKIKAVKPAPSSSVDCLIM